MAEDRKYINVEFLEPGFTVGSRVWAKGQVLQMEDTETTRRSSSDTYDNAWYEQSPTEQQEKYGRVFFRITRSADAS